VRFAYHRGDLRATGPAQHIAALSGGGGHWTRDLRFSPDGATPYVGVGSASNVDDPDDHPVDAGRAVILAMGPDGSGRHAFATGMRNPSGLAIAPVGGQLWAVVNERDGLGDNLVPDYVAAVHAGDFYGWPWWYLGPHPDPRHAGKHAQDRDRARLPEILLQPHSAPLQLEFYTAARFPATYRGDLFVSAHGSWNRSVRTGYEVLRIHEPQAGVAGAGYEEFLTGFVLPGGDVWGRPVGIAIAADGTLLVSDDVSGCLWRIDYPGQ
jgi:glucose/arabinose dehydrogenase